MRKRSRLGLIRWGGDPWLPWWLSPALLAYSAVRGHEKGWPWHSEARSTVPPRRSVYSGGSQPSQSQSQSHCGQWSIPLPPPTPPQPYQKRVNLCSMAVCLFLLVFAGAHCYPQPAGTPSMFFFPAHSWSTMYTCERPLVETIQNCVLAHKSNQINDSTSYQDLSALSINRGSSSGPITSPIPPPL